MNNRESTTQKLVLGGVIAALICLATLIRVQLTAGYFNLGDVVIFAAAFIMKDPIYFAASAGGGCVVSDLVAGMPVYIPGTLVIKFTIGLLTSLAVHKLKSPLGKWALIAVATIIIPVGYFLYEFLILGYGIRVASIDIVWNALQAVIGAVAGCSLGALLKKRINHGDGI